MSSITAIDQSDSISTKYDPNIDESSRADWNGREVTKESSNNELADLIDKVFQENAEKLETSKTDLANATENLKTKTKMFDERKARYKKRKHEDDKAFGWNRKKTEKRLEKAEKKLKFAEHEKFMQKSLVEKLEKEVDVLICTEKHLKSSMEPERYAYLKQYKLLSKDEVKDLQDFDRILNNIESELKTKKEKLTTISQDLDLARSAVQVANKKYEKRVKEHDEASRYKKASKKWKKVKEAEKVLDNALTNCAQKLKEHDDLYKEVDALETQVKCFNSEKKRHQKTEAKNIEQGKNQFDEMRLQLELGIAKEKAEMRTEIDALKLEVENLKTFKENLKTE